MKTILVALLSLSLLGCSTLLKLQGQAEEKTAQGVEAYCKNTDQSWRTQFELGVNAKAFPNSIVIYCPE